MREGLTTWFDRKLGDRTDRKILTGMLIFTYEDVTDRGNLNYQYFNPDPATQFLGQVEDIVAMAMIPRVAFFTDPANNRRAIRHWGNEVTLLSNGIPVTLPYSNFIGGTIYFSDCAPFVKFDVPLQADEITPPIQFNCEHESAVPVTALTITGLAVQVQFWYLK